MGVDYIKWVIPKQRDYRPDSKKIANLANALRENHWAPQRASPGQKSALKELLPSIEAGVMSKKPVREEAFTSDSISAEWIENHSSYELVLEWCINNSIEAGVNFPMTFDPFPESGPPYFNLRVILGHEYFCWTGENVTPFAEKNTMCSCNEQLAYWTGFAAGAPSQRIAYHCPKCGRQFDTNQISCEVMDGWTGQPEPLIGGLTFRFALVVDCHKYWPPNEEQFKNYHLRSDFLDLWNTHIGVPYDVVTTAN